MECLPRSSRSDYSHALYVGYLAYIILGNQYDAVAKDMEIEQIPRRAIGQIGSADSLVASQKSNTRIRITQITMMTEE